MNGFGFIEYEDALDAKDIVPGKLDHRYQEASMRSANGSSQLSVRVAKHPPI